MHILTLTSLFPNKAQPVFAVFVKNRMENFARKYKDRVDWTVVAPVPWFPKLPFKVHPRYDAYARVPSKEDLGGFEVHHPRYMLLPKVGMRHYGRWMSQGVRKTVLEIHKRKPIDAIDGHYVFPDGTAAADLGAELGIPVVLSARGTDLNLYPRMPDIAPLLRKNLERTRHLICVCQELKREALALGMPEDRISVIGNGIDAGIFKPRARDDARRALGLPLDRKIVLSVGHLIERKGFHLILDAFPSLAKDGALLVLAGDGEEGAALRKQAASLGITDSVKFAGAVLNRELPQWYAAADLFVLASSREGWPNVVCEAQAMGLPVVATKVWGLPEIITADWLGILVDERSSAALAPALREALGKTWDRERILAKGQSRTWDKVSEEVAEVFFGLRKA